MIAPSAWLDSYRAELRSAIDRAASDGYHLISANTVGSALTPEELSASGRRHLLRHMAGRGMALASLGCEFSDNGLIEPGAAERRLGQLRDSLVLARELGVRDASVSVGPAADAQMQALREQVLAEAADLSDRVGVRLSVRPTADIEAARTLIARLGCPTLRLAIDTSLVSPAAADATNALSLAAQVNLRDARILGQRIEETDLGAGGVDLRGWLRLMREQGFAGVALVRRDAAGAPVDALRRGRETILSLLAELERA